MIYKGDYATGSTVYHLFSTFAGATGAPITITGLAVGDVKIYKNVSTTERSSTSGITLADTDGIDFDGRTGVHGFSIDLSDNADAGFYAAGNEYTVIVDAITVDSQTVRFKAFEFSIERSGGVLALAKGANGFSAIKTDTAAILVDTGTTLDARIPAALISGRMDVTVGAMQANVMTAAAAASDLTTELQSGLATATDLATVATYVDTEIAAMLAILQKLDDTLEDQGGGTYGFTEEALQEAPSGGAGSNPMVLHEGTAADGDTNEIELDAGASATNGMYAKNVVAITAGTGAGQSRFIPFYDGASKIATVDPAWAVVPDNTSEFIIVPFGTEPATLENVAGAVWGAMKIDHGLDGSFGQRVLADVTHIAGDGATAEALAALPDFLTSLDGRIPAALDDGYMVVAVKKIGLTELTPGGAGGQLIGGA